jgi:hypothetical protein
VGSKQPKTEVVFHSKMVKIVVERFSLQSVQSSAGILADGATKPSSCMNTAARQYSVDFHG